MAEILLLLPLLLGVLLPVLLPVFSTDPKTAKIRFTQWAPFNFDQCPIPFAWQLFGNPPKFPARKISSRILDLQFFRLEVLDYQGYKVGICVRVRARVRKGEAQGDFRDRGCNHNKEQPPHTYTRMTTYIHTHTHFCHPFLCTNYII